MIQFPSSSSSLNPADCWPTATAAVKSILKEHYSGVFTKEDIEDIVSVVVTKMWAARNSFDPAKGKFFSWAWKIARNVIIDSVNDKIHKSNVSGDIEKVTGEVHRLPFAGKTDDDLICDDLLDSFHTSLALARDKRILFYLIDGLGNDEIAKREGISPNAAGLAVFHLRKKLEKVKGSA